MNKQQPKRPVICIIGTTGVGKSQLSIYLAKKLNGEIINADSMQMYKELPQITNKHPIEEREGIEHHVMNHINWGEEYYIHRFKNECETAMEKIWSLGKVPIIVGGTHYYLQSVLFNNRTVENDVSAQTQDEFKDSINSVIKFPQELANLKTLNSTELHPLLKLCDPVLAAKFHPNDSRRIQRALEIYYTTGRLPSELYKEQENQRESGSLKHDVLFFWVYSKLNELDIRLDKRVDKMMGNGGWAEVLELGQYWKQVTKYSPADGIIDKIDKNADDKLDSGIFQVIGFKEFLPYLKENPTCSTGSPPINNKLYQLCLEKMKLHTRQYARRQIKWIKNLLIPQLKEEESNASLKFGKVFVLDATNIDKAEFRDKVENRGLEIASKFMKNTWVESINEIPDSLGDEKGKLIPTDKLKSKVGEWTQQTCEICNDRKTGNPLVFVGDQWEIHLKSKKHRTNIGRGKRKREYEEWLEKQKNHKTD
ncbi:tRNA dimethylallyltransferase [Martiniozyma asiatica (nom. inval.)]|nr:tRNA dimethylallyltransferase [Martiniozyma asiatica]